MKKITVVLSHPLVIFREGIHFTLSGEEDFEVVGETTTNPAAMELIEAGPPDVVILGQKDARISGPDMARRIKPMYPSVAVVLIVENNSAEPIFDALISGVSATITPDASPEDLVKIIRDAAQGRLMVDEALHMPELAARTLADFQDMAALSEHLGIPTAELTKKETDLLTGIASGNTARPNLPEETVRAQLRIVLQKLISNDRTRAIIEKAQRNLPLVGGLSKASGQVANYLTRTEFKEFKEGLTARLNSLVSEKS
jgi:DNA-binding NarL/FixJ family response regulator